MAVKSVTKNSIMYTSLVIICSIVAVGADNVYKMNQHDVANDVMRGNDDVGQLTSCLTESKEPFKFQWSPKVIRPKKTYNFFIDFKIAAEFKTANVCVTVFLKGIPDPIYYDCGTTECSKVHDAIKKVFLDLPDCPISKDYTFKKSKFPYKLDPNIPLPAGEYTLKAEASNQVQQKILCMEGEVLIEDE